jgi:penicillin V acylase-like amidase (Ntn superfamily)
MVPGTKVISFYASVRALKERQKMKTHRDSRRFQNCLLVGIISGLAVLVIAPSARPCTAFLQEGALLMGRNLDWHLDEGLLIVNKKGLSKRAMVLDSREKTAEWVSKYGSVTFNQYGRELPMGGMNEAGLVVESLWLDATRNPAPDERPGLLSWPQYQLDNCRTVAEVVATDKQIRVSPTMPMPLHFFVCDREGQAAVVEFLDGKLACHTGDALPYKLITNNTCEESLAFLKQHEGFGGSKPIKQGSWDSLDRFAVAAKRLKAYQPRDSRQSPLQYAFDTLAAVRQGSATKWTIVYNLEKLEIHYQTDRTAEIRTVQLAGLDFSMKTPVRMINVNTPHKGMLNPHFSDYDGDVNRWMIYYSARHTPLLKDLPDELIEAFARYPEATFSK